MKIYFSSKEIHRKEYMFILALGFIGIGVMAYFIMLGLCHVLWKVDGAVAVIRLCFWILTAVMAVLFAYTAFEGSRNELVFGITEEGKLYRLPSRKQILRDSLFYEHSFELEERMNKQYLLPGLPQNSQEIVDTVNVEKKEGYYLIQCWAVLKEGQEPKRQDYAICPYFNDLDELLNAFRKFM